MRILLLTLLCVSFNITGFSQHPKVDSLLTVIEQASDDRAIADSYIELARTYKEISVDSSLLFFEEAINYFDTTATSKTRTEYYYYLAELYFERGQHDRVLQNLDKAIRDGQTDLGQITKEDIDIRRSQVLLRTGRYEEASTLLLGLLPILEKSDQKAALASCYNGLGTVMHFNKNLEQALDYYQKAHETNLEINDLHNAFGGLANMATIYSRNKDFHLSKSAYQKIIEFCEGRNETHLEALATGNLGLNYRDLNVLDSAEFFIERALGLQKKLNNKRGIARTTSMLSGVLIKQEKHREAIELLLPQYELAEEQKNIRLQDNIARNLGSAYKAVGDPSNSLFYTEKHAELRDTLYKREVADAISDAQTKYETDKKEAEIERLALEDQLSQERITRQRFALGGSVLGLGFLSFLLYRINNQKKKIESQSNVIAKSLSEKEVLLREIHHRVKNNLQVISSLLGLQSRSLEDQVAIDALTQSRARVQSMSLIHQNLYQRDNLTGIHIKDYFEKLSANLINTYRISEEIEIKADIDDILLDVDTVIPLGLILNELLTNCIKYAFPDQKGQINVALRGEANQLFLSVSDDGIGIDNPDDVLTGEGYGYELVTSLVEKLEGTIKVTSEDGTHVKMSFSNFKVLES